MKRILFILLFFPYSSFSQEEDFIISSLIEQNKQKDTTITDKLVTVYQKNDKQKKWLISKLYDSVYRKRLTIELDSNNEAVNDELWKRQNNIKYNYVITKNIPIKGASAYFDTLAHLPEYNIGSSAVHEFTHQITTNGIYITNYAKNLYKKAIDTMKLSTVMLVEPRFFVKDSILYKTKGITERELYSDVAELDAIKKQLEYTLEIMKIKKYDETFTLEHYKILLKLFNNPIKNKNISMFVKIIDPKLFLVIMNNIA
jgi:hypothetical protein